MKLKMSTGCLLLLLVCTNQNESQTTGAQNSGQEKESQSKERVAEGLLQVSTTRLFIGETLLRGERIQTQTHK